MRGTRRLVHEVLLAALLDDLMTGVVVVTAQ
jgi:hypothetical protein